MESKESLDKSMDLDKGTSLNKNMNIDKNTKFVIAKQIISRMIAISSKNGFNPNDEITNRLLMEEQEINNFNEEVIDYVIKNYATIAEDGGFDD